MGFEPTRAEPNGLAVHRLNHSATSSPGEVVVRVGVKLYTYTINRLAEALTRES